MALTRKDFWFQALPFMEEALELLLQAHGKRLESMRRRDRIPFNEEEPFVKEADAILATIGEWLVESQSEEAPERLYDGLGLATKQLHDWQYGFDERSRPYFVKFHEGFDLAEEPRVFFHPAYALCVLSRIPREWSKVSKEILVEKEIEILLRALHHSMYKTSDPEFRDGFVKSVGSSDPQTSDLIHEIGNLYDQIVVGSRKDYEFSHVELDIMADALAEYADYADGHDYIEESHRPTPEEIDMARRLADDFEKKATKILRTVDKS